MPSNALSVGDVAGLLGKHPETVRRWCRRGLLKASRTPGGEFVILRSEVSRLVPGLVEVETPAARRQRGLADLEAIRSM